MTTTTEPSGRLRLVIVVASGAVSRSGPAIASWFLQQAEGHPDFELDVVDLATIGPLPHTLERTPELVGVAPRLGAADAFVFVTPEYNHGYPGGLKNFLDIYRHEWWGKPAAFVSYGGRSGGLRAVEQLRQVIVEQHMVTIRDSLSFDTARLPADVRFPPDPSTAEAAAAMLDQLSWWASALHAQREQHPYKA
ncbi:MAG: NADPH-dependent FMN reductase [Jatrophihabitans sp.]